MAPNQSDENTNNVEQPAAAGIRAVKRKNFFACYCTEEQLHKVADHYFAGDDDHQGDEKMFMSIKRVKTSPFDRHCQTCPVSDYECWCGTIHSGASFMTNPHPKKALFIIIIISGRAAQRNILFKKYLAPTT